MDFNFTFLVAAFPWNDLFGILGGYCRVLWCNKNRAYAGSFYSCSL